MNAVSNSARIPTGTANLTGRELPADRAKTGTDRINALAKSCKTAGDNRRIDAIRSDLFLGMLDGLYQQMTDQQIIDHVLANPVADDHTDGEDGHDSDDGDNCKHDNDGGGNDGPSSSGGLPGSGGPPGSGPSDREGGPLSGGSADNTPPSHEQDRGPGRYDGTTGPGPAERSATSGSGTDDVDADRQAASPAIGSTDTGMPADNTSAPFYGPYTSPWNVAELRVELATLLGLDQHPAELPGLGYIPAAVARPLAARMASAQWRFVICTTTGVPICSGITTRRPTNQRETRRDHKRGGILELQLTASQLDQLATAIASGQHHDWANVITDIAERYHHGIVDNRYAASTADAHSGTETRKRADMDRADTGHTTNDNRRRFARTGLRRWVEARARYCQHPACRMPATQCDQDHRTDYAAGGLTVDENLDPGCRHDHRLQHDGGWVVYRPRGSDPITGPIVWVSPLGHEYQSRPPPVMQPYPEPGHYYPGHDTLPEWFTKLTEQAKAQQVANATDDTTVGDRGTSTTDGESSTWLSEPTTTYPEQPPF